MAVDLQGVDRWQVIPELIDHLVESGQIAPAHRDPILEAVIKRENAMSTGVGFGLAIPHASTNLVTSLVQIKGRSRRGIDFAALDTQPVYKVWLFLVPQGEFQKHSHILADLAKQLHKGGWNEDF